MTTHLPAFAFRSAANGGEKLARGARGRLRTGPTRSDRSRQRRRKRRHLAGPERQAMLGLETGGAGCTLDRVQPVHGERLRPAACAGWRSRRPGEETRDG